MSIGVSTAVKINMRRNQAPYRQILPVGYCWPFTRPAWVTKEGVEKRP
jgi:hypothetical protein